MKTELTTGLCLAALAFCAASQSFAQDKKSPTPEPTATASASPAGMGAIRGTHAIPFWGKISAVDSAAKTFTIAYKSGSIRIFKMTERTKITKDGAPAGTVDVIPDQDVSGSYWRKPGGVLEAKNVVLGTKAETGASGQTKADKSEESSPEPSAKP